MLCASALLESSSDNEIVDNEMSDSGDAGIQLDAGSHRNLIQGNTLVRNGDAGVSIAAVVDLRERRPRALEAKGSRGRVHSVKIDGDRVDVDPYLLAGLVRQESSFDPRARSRVGATGLSLTLSGRNLGLWSDYSGLDPEVNAQGQENFSQSDFLSQPLVRQFQARVWPCHEPQPMLSFNAAALSGRDRGAFVHMA